MHNALVIAHCDMAAHGDRSAHLAHEKLVLFPHGRAIGAIQCVYRALVVRDINIALIDVDAGGRRHVARPQVVAGRQIKAGDSALVGGRTHFAPGYDWGAGDVGHSLEFSGPLGQCHRGLPDGGTVVERYGNQLASREPGQRRLPRHRHPDIAAQ